jgi:hypothetical protein
MILYEASAQSKIKAAHDNFIAAKQQLTIGKLITAMKNYETLVDATNDLYKRGYTANLSLEGDTIDDKEQDIHMAADDFEIDEFYRFEGQSNPSDMSIVYGISSPKYKLKGVLVNAYGTYADNSSSAIEAKLHHNQVSRSLHGSDRPVE